LRITDESSSAAPDDDSEATREPVRIVLGNRSASLGLTSPTDGTDAALADEGPADVDLAEDSLSSDQ
jgi:hypothetical protein